MERENLHLEIALIISLVLHVLWFGAAQYGGRLAQFRLFRPVAQWFERVTAPAKRAPNAVTPTITFVPVTTAPAMRAPAASRIELPPTFMETDDSQVTGAKPSNARFYSDRSTVAANPTNPSGKTGDTPFLDGKETRMLSTDSVVPGPAGRRQPAQVPPPPSKGGPGGAASAAAKPKPPVQPTPQPTPVPQVAAKPVTQPAPPPQAAKPRTEPVMRPERLPTPGVEAKNQASPPRTAKNDQKTNREDGTTTILTEAETKDRKLAAQGLKYAEEKKAIAAVSSKNSSTSPAVPAVSPAGTPKTPAPVTPVTPPAPTVASAANAGGPRGPDVPPLPVIPPSVGGGSGSRREIGAIKSRLTASGAHIGVAAFNVEESPFGAYDKEVIRAVQSHWYALIEQSRLYERAGVVHLHFDLLADGSVKNMEVKENSAGQILGLFCEKAVVDSAPFRPLPQPLRVLIGNDPRDVNFTFYY